MPRRFRHPRAPRLLHQPHQLPQLRSTTRAVVDNMQRVLVISFAALVLVIGAAGAFAPAAHAAAPSSSTNTNNPATTQSPVVPSLSLADGFGGVMIFLMGIFAWLLGVAVITLDNTVYYTVVTMGHYISGLTAIGVTWRILRDLSNIVLIFGFLAIGISIILDVNWYGGGTKMLPMLLVAAVALNFSLFISEAIIDAGNLFATEFYTQINGGNPAGLQDINFDNIANAKNNGIANKIMSQLGLATIYGDVITRPSILTNAFATSFIGFMSIILFLIAAFVMFSLAFILIIRFIVLIFLIILAPIGFVGLAVPQLSQYAKQWWSYLINQTITAPVLLLMLYVALAVITDANFLGFGPTGLAANGGWVGFVPNGTTNLTGFASLILSFLVAMGLLLAVTIFAKKLGAIGSSWATKAAGALSFGAVSFAGRATLGTSGNLLASKHMQKWSQNKYAKYALRPLVFAGKGLRSATYDVRNAPGVATGLGALGVSAGKGATITAKQAHEAQYGWKPTKEWLRESALERDKAAADLKRKKTLASGAPAELQMELKKMSDDELTELRGIRQGQDRLVQALRPTVYDSLMKNKNLLDSEKANIKASWESQFSTHATSAIALGRMTEDERVALGGKILSKQTVYENLTADDFDNIRSAKLQPAEKATITSYVKAQYTAGMAPGAAPSQLQKDLAAAVANPKFKAYYGL